MDSLVPLNVLTGKGLKREERKRIAPEGKS